ncbi:hypothetical protein T265_05449 [Opisthorchis viverrini]|uniref:Uncharacterized protein n=1 Tax=Opisthorchis viverrini TaxID=6198 RepID=A0A074ZJG0_OPIVI|nr:hypothetical protein T265_05449 [Opisthorchis viverrini]KER27483.1 hypothetical protein T265_05449 [Opisthorchis viverrini]
MSIFMEVAMLPSPEEGWVRKGCCGECTGFDIVLNHLAERSLLVWVPADSGTCEFILATSVKESHKRAADRCPPIMSACVPTDGTLGAFKDSSWDATVLLQWTETLNVVVVARNLNTQSG